MATINNPRSRLPLSSKLGIFTALILLSLPALLPMLWMVSTSVKTDAQIFSNDNFSFKSLDPLAVHIG